MNLRRKVKLVAFAKKLQNDPFLEGELFNELIAEVERVRKSIPPGVDLSWIKPELSTLSDTISQLKKTQNTALFNLDTRLSASLEGEGERINTAQQKLSALDKKLSELHKFVLSQAAKGGGGNMNRQMKINGTDYLTRYTDMNLKAGNNITFTVANNDTTKMVDITITASGGGPGGSTREINSITVDTTAGSTSGTDYVYLCSGTLSVTMPDPTTNTSLYTIKNIGTGVVSILPFGVETIDGQASISLGTRYTSVDLVSDTANWNIT